MELWGDLGHMLGSVIQAYDFPVSSHFPASHHGRTSAGIWPVDSGWPLDGVGCVDSMWHPSLGHLERPLEMPRRCPA